MKRKGCIIILTAALVTASVLGLAACGNEEEEACVEHNWDGGRVTREATCAVQGEWTFTCTVCNQTKTEKIAKLTTHSWDEGVLEQPDLSQEGTITYKCTVCGEKDYEAVPAHLEHVWDEGSQLKAPTCSETGSMKYECEICHITETREMQATGEHHFERFIKTVEEATCSAAGSALYECTDCTATTEKEIPVTGKHSLVWRYTDEEHWQECKYCDYGTDKSAHGVWKETNRVPADCAEDGRIDYECECGATKQESIPKGEHNFVVKEVLTPATCGSAGSGLYECSGCHAQKTQEIPATGEHNYILHHSDTVHYSQCTECDAIDESSRTAHEMQYVVDTPATYYATGTRHLECSGCDYSENGVAYELDGYVSDYRNGVSGRESGWTFGHSDYNWSAPTEGRLPGSTGNNESFLFTESKEYNGEAWLVKNENGDLISEIKAGWLNGSWSTLSYTVGENVSNTSYTIALNYKYFPHESHANLYTNANVRIAVLSQDGVCKYSEFISLDGHGADATRDITGLNSGDKIYVFIEFSEAKETDDEGATNSSWSNGDFACRLFEKTDPSV